MAKATSKPAAKLAESETLNGSNTLPALIEVLGKSVQLGEIVRLAHQESGLSVEDWNTLSEVERDALLNWTIEGLKTSDLPPGIETGKPLESIEITSKVDPDLYEALFAEIRQRLDDVDADKRPAAVKVLADELLRAVDALGSGPQPILPEPMTLVFAERIYLLSAPAGPRRRAGIALGPVPIEVTWDEFAALCGDQDPATVLKLLLADPMVKIDGRFEERPAEPEERLN